MTASFQPSGAITDYCNEKVKGIYDTLKPYAIDSYSGKVKVVRKDLTALQNDGKYEGEWSVKENMRHGAGIQVWNDGSIYEGLWEHDKAAGPGRLIHADGDVYEGNWKDDKADG